MNDFFDASDRIRSHDDIAREHACRNELSDESIDIAWLLTAAIGVTVLNWLVWWAAK